MKTGVFSESLKNSKIKVVREDETNVETYRVKEKNTSMEIINRYDLILVFADTSVKDGSMG